MADSFLEPFPVRVRRLAAERGYSLDRLAMEAWDPNVRGTSANLFREVLKGRRALKPTLLEAVARALSVDPEEFPEYRLAMARRALDETEVGLDEAVATLSRAEEALGTRRLRRAAARKPGSPKRSREDPDAPKTRPGA